MSSWNLDCVRELEAMEGVIKVRADMCHFGLRSEDGQGEGFAMKPTVFMTNSPCIAEALAHRCRNKTGSAQHRHVA